MTTPETPPGDDPADAYIEEVGWGFRWRVGQSFGHEPTRELARRAVERALQRFDEEGNAMADKPDVLEVCSTSANVLDRMAAAKRKRADALFGESHLQMRRWAGIDEKAAETICLLAEHIQRFRGQVAALTAENDAAWDALAGMAEHLTDDQITKELERRGIDMIGAMAKLREAKARKAEAT